MIILRLFMDASRGIYKKKTGGGGEGGEGAGGASKPMSSKMMASDDFEVKVCFFFSKSEKLTDV